MLELDHLTVSGDVTFGKNVSLKVSTFTLPCRLALQLCVRAPQFGILAFLELTSLASFSMLLQDLWHFVCLVAVMVSCVTS